MTYGSSIDLGEGRRILFEKIQKSIKSNRVISLVCLVIPLLILFYSVIHVLYRVEGEVKSDLGRENELVGSNLSHIMSIKGGWSYRLEVDEIVAINDSSDDKFGVARLRGAKITAFNSDKSRQIVLYSPEAIWEQEKLIFHMFGGCRVSQGQELNLTTESILVDFNNRVINIDNHLRAVYGDSWFFEASGVTWDMDTDNLTFDGDIWLGSKGDVIG